MRSPPRRWLQWGRVLTNAETTAHLSGRSAARGLQWGRVLTNAETTPSLNHGHAPNGASMGPRSHERGNNWTAWCTAGGYRASMGPRSHERGNRETIDAPCQKQLHASMGPRSHERGNPGVADSGQIGCGRASMGPRSHERGNMPTTASMIAPATLSFNGAAFSRTRKHAASLTAAQAAPGLLQWGRVLTNAET